MQPHVGASGEHFKNLRPAAATDGPYSDMPAISGQRTEKSVKDGIER
jgi:hypothetical protein